MEFLKKNWITVLVVAIIVAIILYYIRKKKAESSYMITGCPPETTPNPTTGRCGNLYSWDQIPKGIFPTQNGGDLASLQRNESSYKGPKTIDQVGGISVRGSVNV